MSRYIITYDINSKYTDNKTFKDTLISYLENINCENIDEEVTESCITFESPMIFNNIKDNISEQFKDDCRKISISEITNHYVFNNPDCLDGVFDD